MDLENAELTCWIEIVEKYALIYVERLPGPGGLPVGTSGKVVVLVIRRHRFAGCGLENDQARLHADFRPFSQFSVHEQGIPGKGQTDWAGCCRNMHCDPRSIWCRLRRCSGTSWSILQ